MPVRQSLDLPYAKLLDDIGNGTLPTNDNGEVTLDLIQATTDLEKLIDFVYPNLRTHGQADTTSSAILAVRNIIVDTINNIICKLSAN